MSSPNPTVLTRMRDAYPVDAVPDSGLEQMAKFALAGVLDPARVPDPSPEHHTVTFCHPLGQVILLNAVTHERWAEPDNDLHGFHTRLILEIGDAHETDFAGVR